MKFAIVEDLLDLAVKSVVLLESDKFSNHHGAKFFIHLSVHHHSPWKLCVSMYLTPERQLLHSHVLHFVHSLKRKETVTLKFLCTFSNDSRWSVLRHGKLLPLFNHSCFKVSVAQTV
jgi:hypothetical protein